jgi:hypothetical protein
VQKATLPEQRGQDQTPVGKKQKRGPVVRTISVKTNSTQGSIENMLPLEASVPTFVEPNIKKCEKLVRAFLY